MANLSSEKIKPIKTLERKQWHLIDADGLILGRLSTIIASMLRGKHKPSFAPNKDCGDNIIVINAEKIKLTGKKAVNKTYYYHTGYPGGIKSSQVQDILSSDKPEKVILMSVKRMLPKTVMGRKQIGNLKVYSGTKHPHEGQNPSILDIKSMNKKNYSLRN